MRPEIRPQPGPAASGAKECKAQDLMVCNGSGVLQSEATCPYLCTSGACTGICKPGEMKCEGNMVSTCTDKGAWNANALCSTVCGEKGCTGVCAPGAMQCDKASLQSCNAEGKWQDTAACAYVCQDNACSGICTPGTRQCKGNQPQICNPKGAWADDGTACPFVCSSGACAGACTDGATQCSTNTPQTCTDGVFKDGTRLPVPLQKRQLRRRLQAGSVSSAWPTFCRRVTPTARGPTRLVRSCAAPMPAPAFARRDSTRCNGKTQQVCNQQAQWVDSTACPFLCTNGQCSGVCNPGSKVCSSLTPQTCDATGAWTNGTNCPFVCTAGSCAGVVLTGRQAVQWQHPTDLRSRRTMGERRGVRGRLFRCRKCGTCTPGAKGCSGIQPQTCDANGNWANTGAACPFVCSAGACAGSCVPGAKQCNGATPQTCGTDGLFHDEAKCASLCIGAGICGVCQPGAKQCNGTTPQTCSNSRAMGERRRVPVRL